MSKVTPSVLARFTQEMGSYDEAAHFTLKGHLLIEEILNDIVTTFVFHPEKLKAAKLTHFHLISLARSMSLREQDNPMWDLLLAINTLRNRLSHRADDATRKDKLDAVFAIYDREKDPNATHDESAPHVKLGYAIALCLGFLDSFRQEVLRFKVIVMALDAKLNSRS